MKIQIRNRVFMFVIASPLFFTPLAFASATSASIPSVTPATTVLNGQTVYFSVLPSGFTNPTYSISDSFTGSSASSANMDTYGNFSWTPTDTDGGVHTFTVTVSDSVGDPSATASQTINVQAPASISVTDPQPGRSVAASSTLTFSISKLGLTNPTYRIVDSFFNSTLTTSNLNSSGSFSWAPAQTDIGSHDFTIFATDIYQRTALTTFSVQVTRTPVQVATTTPPSVLQAPVSTTVTPTTPPSSNYVFSKYLYLGLTHPDVKKMQEKLTALGFYSGPISGYFGSLTQVAVKKFQAARGLEQVGSVGPSTRAALNK